MALEVGVEAELDDSGGEEDEGEIIDWQLPLCFMKKRHRERIEGGQPLAQTWRMKERVWCAVFYFFFTFGLVLLDLVAWWNAHVIKLGLLYDVGWLMLIIAPYDGWNFILYINTSFEWLSEGVLGWISENNSSYVPSLLLHTRAVIFVQKTHLQ